MFQTCVYLGKKSGSQIEYELIHDHSDFYDTILDFDGSKAPQILVPSGPKGVCGNIDLVPSSLKQEIRKLYMKWSAGHEAYNYTYNMPEAFPIWNLYLFNEVKIYKFGTDSKIDVTKDMKPYLNLKRKVLSALIKQKNVTKECKLEFQKILGHMI